MMDTKQIYSVWVDGGEINDHYLNWSEAFKLAQSWKDKGYDDVMIRREI